MPVLQPEDLWQRSGRAASMGPTLFRLHDRRDRPLVLGPTHEEVVTTLVHQNVHSYRDLPLNLYQIQTKLRDEARPRAGLIRVREFAMKDAYSFDADEAGLDATYQRMVQAYRNIFARCGLDVVVVEADSGAIGGKDSQEFMLLSDYGEDDVVLCRSCGYARQSRESRGADSSRRGGNAQRPDAGPDAGVTTIAALAELLGIPEAKTLKAVFYSCDGEVVFVTIRGDLEVNEVKMKNALKCTDLHLATDDEVRAAGLVAGYASPIGLERIRRLGDRSIESGANYVVGANRSDTHYQNATTPATSRWTRSWT